MLLNRKNPHGGDIYKHPVRLDFSANINPFGMPDAVKQAVIDAVDVSACYPDPTCSDLRKRIAEVEGVIAEQILCGNGAAELIYSFAFALPKDRPALIVSPSFCEYEQAIIASGGTAEHFLLREEDDFRLTEAVLDTDFSRYSTLFVCSPNNPTGLTIVPELLRALCETGVRLFCDFCFLDLTDEPGRYDIPALIWNYPNLTVLKAFTKTYAMAGLRLGYMLSSDLAFLENMSEKAPCWNVSTLAQKAGIVAFSCREWLIDSVNRISVERKRMLDALSALGLRVVPGEANYLFLYADRPLPTLLMEHGIMVRDCSNYIGLSCGWFRLAVRTREENDELLRVLRELLS